MTVIKKDLSASQPEALVKYEPSAAVGFNSADGFALLQRAGALLAASTLVPEDYRNHLPNCVIALNMAQRIGADPLMVMQNLYIVHGRPGWSAQFLIATFNQCGRFSALRYEWVGEPGTDGRGCRAWALEKATGEKLEGSLITVQLSKDEGWYDRKDKYGKYTSKWRTMPEQMLMYRSAAWFIRAYAPEIAMGLHTVDELQDTVIDVEPSRPVVITPDTLLSGTAIGENGVEPGATPAAPSEPTPPKALDPEEQAERRKLIAAIQGIEEHLAMETDAKLSARDAAMGGHDLDVVSLDALIAYRDTLALVKRGPGDARRGSRIATSSGA